MNKYTRQFNLSYADRDLEDKKVIVEFDDTSTIMFYYEDGDEVLCFDPSFLKSLYHAYRGMEKEINEDKENKDTYTGKFNKLLEITGVSKEPYDYDEMKDYGKDK